MVGVSTGSPELSGADVNPCAGTSRDGGGGGNMAGSRYCGAASARGTAIPQSRIATTAARSSIVVYRVVMQRRIIATNRTAGSFVRKKCVYDLGLKSLIHEKDALHCRHPYAILTYTPPYLFLSGIK